MMLKVIQNLVLCLSVVGLFVGGKAWAQAGGSPALPKDAADTPLIPRTVLFGNPDKAGPQLSPDGSRLAYLAAVDGVLNVWVGPADNPDAAKPVTEDKNRGIRMYFWAWDNCHILYIQDKDGDENWHIYATDPTTKETRDLTPIDGVQARFQGVSHKFPNEILIGLNDRKAELHDIHHVNIKTGERKLILENEGYLGFTTDDDYVVRLASKITPDGGHELFKTTDGGKTWEPFMKIARDDVLTTGPRGFDKSGKTLYMSDSRGRDTAALIAYDLESGKKKVLASNPRADAGSTMMHPIKKMVEAVAFTYARRQWAILDDSIRADLEYLKKVADGEMNVIDRTRDDRHWLVAYVMDNGPVRYYNYDRDARKAKFMFVNRKDLEGLPLTKMHPAVVKSRDGLNLVNYLSLPLWADRDENGRPEKPLPMVLMVHGGPWARDSWGFSSMDQWLANRGYAVLSVNFRGSTGFGKNFANAGDLQWGAKMHDDLIDAVKWAVKERIADPKRVAVMGGSYGGYATLVGLTFTPDVFACGVDIVGPSSLLTLLESIPPYWKPMLDVFTTRVGDHRTEEGKALLIERSPLTHVHRICRPLLIGQGANDPRVKQAEADQIVKAMEEKNIPVTYVLFSDEGHGFARPENRIAFFAVAEAFLSKHLGGRYEPVGKDFEGSTIAAPKGAAGVPGLAQALKTRP